MHLKELLYIRVLDRAGAILYEGLPINLPIPEHVILEKCLHYFNDPSPCHIRRGAVLLRIAAEIQQELSQNPRAFMIGPLAVYFSGFSKAHAVEGFIP